jgi:hypothetical protein
MMRKKIIIALATFLVVFTANVLYWTLSDIQQDCFIRIKNGAELNLYEKFSIYSINLCICAFGWPFSPEATRQQIWCTFPTNDTIIAHSDYFSNHEKIKSLIKKHPNATVDNPTKIAWKAYTFQNARIALACNGMFLYKDNGEWVISNIKEFAFPVLPEPTIIGPFKFHESLIRYLQDIGWLYKPHFKWALGIG